MAIDPSLDRVGEPKDGELISPSRIGLSKLNLGTGENWPRLLLESILLSLYSLTLFSTFCRASSLMTSNSGC